jgi:GTP cyclohydrolase I
MVKILTIEDINGLALTMTSEIYNNIGGSIKVYGVPRGGIPVAYIVANHYPAACIVVGEPENADVIVDDIIDSGKTRNHFVQLYKKPFFALIDKERSPDNDWYVFPWEGDVTGSIQDVPLRMLQYIGEDVTRDGLKDTPARVIRSWGELYSGYKQDPMEILSKVFENSEKYNEMVLLRDIEFYSTCEHHLLPFFGKAHIAYIPGETGKVVGISKLARLVECFSRRVQIQERLTKQIHDAINEALQPLGVAVLIEAKHMCMIARGIQKQNASMSTSAISGVFEKPEVRAEFFSLVRGK